MRKVFFAFLALFFACSSYAQEDFTEEKTQTPTVITEEKTTSLSEMDLFIMPYGLLSSAIETHVYISIQYWNYEDQALGKYANEGSSSAGHSDIIPYSGYIDLASVIRKNMKVEAEFELYKGGAIKVCRLRGVWQPEKWMTFSFGRDFGIIGLQDKLYYPTSKYKLFTIPPFLHQSVIRYTGWWDSGAFVSFKLPLPLIAEDGEALVDLSVTNGPGIASAGTIKTNTDGYMYEHFHDAARQATDNNHDKPVAVRCSLLPVKWLEFGGSYMNAKWDSEDQHFAQYAFSHFLCNFERLTVVAEYGQLKFGTPNNDTVSQFSGYFSAGYNVLQGMDYIEFLQPVIRYEHYDSWKEDPSRKGYRESFSAGLRYAPFPGWIIKMAYQITLESKGPDLDNDGFAAEMVFEF